MKTVLFAAMLCILGITAKSQNVINNTGCKIWVRPVCYDPTTCTYTVCGGATVCFPGATGPLPTCDPPGCSATTVFGYQICWDNSTCTCTTMGVCWSTNSCSVFGNSATLPACGTCPAASINCTTTGDIVVH